jgi:hypothetical protein
MPHPTGFHNTTYSRFVDLHRKIQHIEKRIRQRLPKLLSTLGRLGHGYVSQKAGGRVIAYGCLIKKKEALREHLDYIYRGLMTQHAKVHCNSMGNSIG